MMTIYFIWMLNWWLPVKFKQIDEREMEIQKISIQIKYKSREEREKMSWKCDTICVEIPPKQT